MSDIKKTALYDTHVGLGAKMIPFAGFMMPVRYTGDIEEHIAVRQYAGLFDVSHMGEVLLTGAGAAEIINKITTNNVAKLFPGRVQYSLIINENGGIIDDLLVYMLAENKYMLVINASNTDKDLNWIRSHATPDVTIEDISEHTCLLALQGPRSIDILSELTSASVKDIPYYHFIHVHVANVPDVLVSATGYTGAGGFELYTSVDHVKTLWSALLEAGSTYGLKPAGLGARDTLRLEKAYTLYGNDMDETITPLQVNLSWAVDLSKEFIGKNALLNQKKNGTPTKWVGFTTEGNAIPRKGYKLFSADDEEVGVVTSGTQSPLLKKGIGMAHIKTSQAQIGATLYIEIRQQKIPVTVVKTPFVN